VEVSVFNNTGRTARMVAWFDFNGDGDFDPAEAFTLNVPSSASQQTLQLPVTVPLDADVTTGGNTYARFRLTTDAITANDPLGIASDGEVEDYPVAIDPPGLIITKTDGQNSIVVGQATTYTITIGNSGTDVTNRNFVDNIPIADPDGFDPATITWTCTATGGASCVTGGAANTGANGTGQINEFIDIPRNSQIVYSLTGTLRSNYSQPNVTNTATLSSGESAQDINGVISDPPFGTKIGVTRAGNIIRWTMVWFNTGAAQAATVGDVLQANQTFNGNLVCTAFGISTTANCTYMAGTRTVEWQGVIDTGNPNRVEIAFDVIVPGAGSYSNSANINVGGATATAAAAVVIGSPGAPAAPVVGGASDSAPDTAGLFPVISKSADPAFAATGDTVNWTIRVSNPHSVALPDVKFVDTVPGSLDVLSAVTSAGIVTVNGQTVNFAINDISPGDTVTIIVQTRVRAITSAEEALIENVAILLEPYEDCECSAKAQLVVVNELPATGETPWWRQTALVTILIVMSAGVYVTYRAKHLLR
ncbi:MAG: GEVED domain-containing protein, partial [Aggregatilineales bacterium]